MEILSNDRNVTLQDLLKDERYARIENAINCLIKGQFDEFNDELDKIPDNKADRDFMMPILWAVKHDWNTYKIYRYFAPDLQKNKHLTAEIILTEPELIENTPLSRDPEFIIENAEKAPEIIKHMSSVLKDNPIVIAKLLDCDNKQVRNEIATNCNITKIFEANPQFGQDKFFMLAAIIHDSTAIEYASEELKNNKDFGEKVCYESIEASSYIADHVWEFSDEFLQGSQKGMKEKFMDDVIQLANEMLSEINKIDIEKRTKEDNDKIRTADTIIKLCRRVQEGKSDAVRLAHIFYAVGKNIDPEYRGRIEEFIKISNEIETRECIEDIIKKSNNSLEEVKTTDNGNKTEEDMKKKLMVEKIMTMCKGVQKGTESLEHLAEIIKEYHENLPEELKENCEKIIKISELNKKMQERKKEDSSQTKSDELNKKTEEELQNKSEEPETQPEEKPQNKVLKPEAIEDAAIQKVGKKDLEETAGKINNELEDEKKGPKNTKLTEQKPANTSDATLEEVEAATSSATSTEVEAARNSLASLVKDYTKKMENVSQQGISQ